MNYDMKKKKYLHTNFIKFLVEKYNKEIQNEEKDLPEDKTIGESEELENDESEEDEPIEDLIAEYKDLYKKFEDKKYDAIFKRR
jgi:hypothetical protein